MKGTSTTLHIQQTKLHIQRIQGANYLFRTTGSVSTKPDDHAVLPSSWSKNTTAAANKTRNDTKIYFQFSSDGSIVRTVS